MKTLGVFDSGLGGFNVVAKLKEKLSLNITFLADHKNLPYGLKSDEELLEILSENMEWFISKEIDHVLIACNTASNYIEFLRDKYPNLTIDSIIEITSKQFNDEDLIIFGTNKTVENKKYDFYLNKEHNYKALSDLATLVEENNDEKIKKYLELELSEFDKDKNYLLACTHYSLVMDDFKKLLGNNIYDSIDTVLEYYQDYTGESKLEVYTSGNIKVLAQQIYSIFNLDVVVLPYRRQYKMVIVSDNHGLYAPLIDILELHKDASVFVHCGDVELNDDMLNNYYVVNGNNDYFKRFDDHILLSIYDNKYYITHGHEYMRFDRYQRLYDYGKDNNIDIVFFGHEHTYQLHDYKDLIILNPGSVYYNRDNSGPSYAIVYVDDKDFKIERVNLRDELR